MVLVYFFSVVVLPRLTKVLDGGTLVSRCDDLYTFLAYCGDIALFRQTGGRLKAENPNS